MAKLTFEKAMEQLEKIVQTMESGTLSLEQSLKQFEEGMRLSQFCAQKLDETEKKISLIMEKADGAVDELPFDDQNE